MGSIRGGNAASNPRTNEISPRDRRQPRRQERDRAGGEQTEEQHLSRLLHEGDEEDCEDEDEEYETQNEDEEADDDGDDQDAEDADDGDGLGDEEDENDLECYLRKRGIDESRLRARTAPLRPMEHVEQFKMTPNFTNLEQAAVCAVQIVQRND